jgi:hypothetical protein
VSQEIADPFAGEGDDDLFDTPQNAYNTIDEIDGRLIAVFPKRLGSRKGSNGDMYEYVTADVLVIDGGPLRLVGNTPGLIRNMQISASRVVEQTRENIGTGRPVLGRISSRPSSYNKLVPVYNLDDPSAADKTLAAPHARTYMAENTFSK